MTALRNVWADLVEKRLWPLAALLLLGLVAVPLVLGRGSDPAPAPAAAAAPPAAAAKPAAQPVRVEADAPAAPPRGPYHDPFAGAAKPAAPAGTGPTTAPAPSGADAPASGVSISGGVGGGSAPSPSPSAPSAPAGTVTGAPSPQQTDAPRPAAPRAGHAAGYRVDLSFGRAGRVASQRDVLRLSPLRAGSTPLLVFVGVRPDGRTALFLLTSNAAATGDARCYPTDRICQLIELRAGDSEFFDVPTGELGVVQYELDLDRVAPRRADTAAAAEKLRKAESKTGRRIMMETVRSGRTYLADFMYRSSEGVVRRVPRARKAALRAARSAQAPAAPAPQPVGAPAPAQ